MNSNKINGVWGWVGLAVWVSVWDSWQRADTMSDAWYSAWSGRGKGLTLVLWTLTTQHLFRPMSYDMFNLIGKLYGKVRRNI